MTRLGRDANQSEQDKLREAAKLREQADALEREARVEAQRPVRNRPVSDNDFQATVYTPPKASDIFGEEKEDKVAAIIRDYDPTKRRRGR